MSAPRLTELNARERTVEEARHGDPELGPLRNLPGTWKGEGTGWNVIALPFGAGPGRFRLLLNQYDETLNFSLVDKAVPNRGLASQPPDPTGPDQKIVTLDYEQVIKQVAVVDEPASEFQGAVGAAIHHEPGLFLNMVNLTEDELDVARLATIPHGDAALALGRSDDLDLTNGFTIPSVSGLPIGVEQDLESRYLAPYKHFHENPFFGTVPTSAAPGFPGFDPVEPHKLLDVANSGLTFTSVTRLELDTTLDTGGIHNIPFVVKQANAVSMKSTFWIQELPPSSPGGTPDFRLQYLQIVMLDFLPRRDGLPGTIGWPHVSINTLTKESGQGYTQ